jgi:hypothetical protein
MQDLVGELQRKGEPVFEAVAMDGTGVFDTLKAVAKQGIDGIKEKLIRFGLWSWFSIFGFRF